jgi:hypothetical protein
VDPAARREEEILDGRVSTGRHRGLT